MISIFRKKDFLIDHLEGITDIHNHILPGIDDGAQNVEESIGLLEKFRDLGITKFIATPHIMNDYYPNTHETINSALTLLKKEISENKSLKNTEIRFAAEYMMDQNFLELMKTEKLLSLQENMVLVEMSYFQAPINLNDILFKLQTNGYKPVLAHPERYAFYHTKDLSKYEELKNRGCLFQLNTLSLTPHYGTNMQKIAYKLLENGMIDFIGSDTHRLQHLEKIETITIQKKTKDSITNIISKTKERFL
ncbi:tyrosine-protein phosphatase [Gillisia sp. JM1]|uniref:tyrosine-protein phosphatase n=1 Tax=Gillisia sp. JM1 TaxID=1283286 RepID=UPI0004286547|nr:CpsB/CapC family capsule biosynthesis tyrosine phosphatase [Gillisia sp. JM1]